MTPITPLVGQPGSPRTHPGSPRIASPREWDKDCSFESGFESSSKDETQAGSNIGRYKETLLLHDTLKCLAVKESTQEAANVTINRFICLTVVITNILSISISILGTILVINYIRPNSTINLMEHHHVADTLPEHLPRGVHDVQRREESLAMTDRDDEKGPTYQPLTVDPDVGGALTYLPMDQIQPVNNSKSNLDNNDLAADSYRIEIRVTQPSNDSLADTEDDFWLD